MKSELIKKVTEKVDLADLYIDMPADTMLSFKKNAFVFMYKYNAELAKVDPLDTLQKLAKFTKMGFDFLQGDATPVLFQEKLVIMPDWRKEKEFYEQKFDAKISFLMLRKEDKITQYGEYEHTFEIAPRAWKPSEVTVVNKTSSSGKTYQETEKKNLNTAYACIVEFATGEKKSYVESTDNILKLAKQNKNIKFYKDGNAQDTMYKKFVMRQLLQGLTDNSGASYNFNAIEYAEVIDEPITGADLAKAIEEVEPAIEIPQETATTETAETPANTEPKTTDDDKKWLNENSVEYDNVLKGIESGAVKSVADVRKFYAVSKAMEEKINEKISENESKNH